MWQYTFHVQVHSCAHSTQMHSSRLRKSEKLDAMVSVDGLVILCLGGCTWFLGMPLELTASASDIVSHLCFVDD